MKIELMVVLLGIVLGVFIAHESFAGGIVGVGGVSGNGTLINSDVVQVLVPTNLSLKQLQQQLLDAQNQISLYQNIASQINSEINQVQAVGATN